MAYRLLLPLATPRVESKLVFALALSRLLHGLALQQAREAGWQGRIIMRLHVAANGVPAGLCLIGDSGYLILDQAALDMMRLAAGHTPVPVSLHGQDFIIDLAVDYKLDDPAR